MSMLHVHQSAVMAPTVAMHEFLGLFQAKQATVYIFVEGKDDPSFYKTHVDAYLPSGRSLT
jgi:hypothetical protein